MFYKTLTGVLAGLSLSLVQWLLLQNIMTLLHFNAPRLVALILLNLFVGVFLTWFYAATKDFLPRMHVLKELLMSLGLFVFYIPMLMFLFAFGTVAFGELIEIFIAFVISFIPAAIIFSFFV